MDAENRTMTREEVQECLNMYTKHIQHFENLLANPPLDMDISHIKTVLELYRKSFDNLSQIYEQSKNNGKI